MALHRREWGLGPPVVALHGLGVDSSSYEDLGAALAWRSIRTIAPDLPGFGRTPSPGVPLTPAVLAAPVVALARSLPAPPVVLGLSMGGRVALEVALAAPDAVAGVIAVAPYLPWLRFRGLLGAARVVEPELARWLPLELAWPVLRWVARGLETMPVLRDDALARAIARLVYQLACPATRVACLSAAREMALDPAHGPDGLWTRLPQLGVPAAFVWGARDELVTMAFARPVARTVPAATHVLLPCTGHALNGVHHRCLAEAVSELVVAMQGRGAGEPALPPGSGLAFARRPCIASAPRLLGEPWRGAPATDVGRDG